MALASQGLILFVLCLSNSLKVEWLSFPQAHSGHDPLESIQREHPLLQYAAYRRDINSVSKIVTN